MTKREVAIYKPHFYGLHPLYTSRHKKGNYKDLALQQQVCDRIVDIIFVICETCTINTVPYHEYKWSVGAISLLVFIIECLS